MEINKVKNQNLKALKIGIRKLNSKIDCKKSKNQNIKNLYKIIELIKKIIQRQK